MTDKKQIEEIANILYESDNKRNIVICGIEAVAEDLYNAGYRKQEWISVDERLPEDGVRVLVAHDDGIVRLGISKGGFPAVMSKSRLGQPFPLAEVTHWMPLPELPKMKGCVE